MSGRTAWTGRPFAAHASALIAGALLPGAFSPFGIWPLAVVCPAVLLALVLRLEPRAAALRGWFFGAGMFGTGSSWVYVSIHDFGYAPVPLAAALTLGFCLGLALVPAATVWVWARFFRERRGGVLLGFPAAWVLGEWCRIWLLTGFPWLYLGYSQLDGPLAGWAPVGGVLGLGALLAFTAAALVVALQQGRRWPIALLIAALLWGLGPALSRVDWVRPQGDPLEVAMVQGNIPQELKWEPGHLETTLETYAQLSEPLWGVDLVVWPEAALPAYFDRLSDYLQALARRAAVAGSTLLTGVPTRIANPDANRGFDVFNSVVAIGADSGLYHKRHLVPFGEYVPLDSVLRGLIAFFDLPMSSFSAGPAEQPLLGVKGLQLAPFICYEIVFPDMVASALPDADVLLTVSNDTWFGRSIGPLQHLQMARMRALENGRPLIRATNNGVSALVDARGEILVRGGQFTREVVRGEIQPTTGATPYSRTGSAPLIVLAILVLAGVRASRNGQ